MHIVNEIARRGSKIANAMYVMGCSGGLTLSLTRRCLLHVLKFVGFKARNLWDFCRSMMSCPFFSSSIPILFNFSNYSSQFSAVPTRKPSLFVWISCFDLWVCWSSCPPRKSCQFLGLYTCFGWKIQFSNKSSLAVSPILKQTTLHLGVSIHGVTPIVGCFVSGKILSINAWSGTPWLRKPPYRWILPDDCRHWCHSPLFQGGFPGGLQQLVGALRPSAAHFAHLSAPAALGEAAARPARGAHVPGLGAWVKSELWTNHGDGHGDLPPKNMRHP